MLTVFCGRMIDKFQTCVVRKKMQKRESSNDAIGRRLTSYKGILPLNRIWRYREIGVAGGVAEFGPLFQSLG